MSQLSAASLFKTAAKWLLVFVLIGGVFPAFRAIYARFSTAQENERTINEVVSASQSDLPVVMDNGTVRLDSVANEAGVLTWRHTLLSYSSSEIDPQTMPAVLKTRALYRVDRGENFSDLVLRGVPIAYLYSDKDGKTCVSFTISREDLIAYRREQFREDGGGR